MNCLWALKVRMLKAGKTQALITILKQIKLTLSTVNNGTLALLTLNNADNVLT